MQKALFRFIFSGMKKEGDSNLDILRNILQSEASGHMDTKTLQANLLRLNALTSGVGYTPPEYTYQLALRASQTSILETAHQYDITHGTVDRAVRDLLVIFIHFLGPFEGIQVRQDTLLRLETLCRALQQSEQSQRFRNHPQMQKALARLKHAAALIDCFTEYGTPQPLLESQGVKASLKQSRSVREYVLGNDTNTAVEGLAPLAQKFLFASWLNNDNFPVTHPDPERFLLNKAIFILQTDITSLNAAAQQRIRDMRVFLIEAAKKEYPDVTSIRAALEAYKLYREHSTIPQFITTQIKLFLEGSSPRARISQIRPGEFFSEERLLSIEWAGRKFMEAALLAPQRGKPHLSHFVLNTTEILKTAKIQVLNQNL